MPKFQSTACRSVKSSTQFLCTGGMCHLSGFRSPERSGMATNGITDTRSTMEITSKHSGTVLVSRIQHCLQPIILRRVGDWMTRGQPQRVSAPGTEQNGFKTNWSGCEIPQLSATPLEHCLAECSTPYSPLPVPILRPSESIHKPTVPQCHYSSSKYLNDFLLWCPKYTYIIHIYTQYIHISIWSSPFDTHTP